MSEPRYTVRGMEPAPSVTRAVIYVRISDDREGAGAGVGRQEEDSRALAVTLGWTIGEVIIENDRSAFKRRKVRRPNGRTELRVIRPGFQHMLELIESGAADALVAYDLDRTARDPRDLEDLIDLVEQRAPRLPVRSVTGSLRLDNDADVTMARVMVAVANKSSRDTQRRVARKHLQLAQEGRYAGGGARRYGYAKDGVTIVEEEAAIIREAAGRILAGESANSIMLDLNRRGVRPVKAKQWSGRTLIGILGGGRIAGLRIHQGKVIGPAQWPPIIDEDTHHELVAQLEANASGRAKPPLRYWANGLLLCGKCGHGLTGLLIANSGGKYRYWCSTVSGGCGGIGIAGAAAEGELRNELLEYLARPDVARSLSQTVNQANVEEVRKLLAEDEAELKALAQAHGNKQITLAEWLAAREPIAARIETHSGVLRSVMPQRIRRVLEQPDRAAGFDELDAQGKRELMQAILGLRGYLGWEVAPYDPALPRRFDPSRLSLLEV